ncbi:MAG: hypothetical protein ACI9UJ_000726 [bacterium]
MISSWHKPHLMNGLVIILIFAITGCPFLNKNKIQCQEYPKSIGYVNDFEHIFSSNHIDSLSSFLTDYEALTTNEIAIVTVDSFSPDSSLEAYTFNLAQCWGVGKKNKNNGVVIVFSTALRQIHIQNGAGTTEELTNAETKQIIDNIITPSFKQTKYYEGIHNAVVAIMKELE